MGRMVLASLVVLASVSPRPLLAQVQLGAAPRAWSVSLGAGASHLDGYTHATGVLAVDRLVTGRLGFTTGLTYLLPAGFLDVAGVALDVGLLFTRHEPGRYTALDVGVSAVVGGNSDGGGGGGLGPHAGVVFLGQVAPGLRFRGQALVRYLPGLKLMVPGGTLGMALVW